MVFLTIWGMCVEIFKINIIILLIFWSTDSVAQKEEKIEKSTLEIDNTIYRLIRNDSIVEARIFLDTIFNHKKSEPDDEFLLSYNYNYGLIFMTSGKPNEASNYIFRAKEISKKIPGNSYESNIKVVILRLFRETNRYKELDSLYQKYLDYNEESQNGIIFFHHLDYIISEMNRSNFKQVISTSRKVLSDLDEYDYTKMSKESIHVINDVVRNELKIYFAMALMEKGIDYQKSYQLLNETERDSLFFVQRERDEYLRLIQQYKARYFYKYNKNMDSVSYYQALSNKYQETYIKKLKRRASNADIFIYEIAKNKKDIEQLSIINEKNIQIQKSYFQVSFLTGFLLLLTTIFSVYVYRSNNHKNRINEELKEKNAELLTVDEERNQFFSIMSHELRTPIYTIQGLVEIIENTKNQKQRKEFLSTLKFSNNHLSGLVNNALEYSKFRLGNVRLNKDAFSLDEMLMNICNSFSYQLRKSNTKLHIEIADDVETNVLDDRLKLSQIFINLISNAIKFTTDGNIWIELVQIASFENMIRLRFTVRDDGIGIKKELVSDVFDGFKGIHHIDKHKGGSGLGLYIVKRFIEDLYKSSIVVESEEGKGTSFSFEIEMERNLKNTKAPIVNDEDYANVLDGYSMLVVDDNTINLMITKKVLESAGAICTTVDNGFDAILLIQEKDYDVVFMDIHMPEQDGFETTQKIREFNKDVIIMALTAVDLERVVTKVYQSGMNGIITKPYKRSDLFQKILSFSLKKD